MGIKIGFTMMKGPAARACILADMPVLVPATPVDVEEMSNLKPNAIYTTEFVKMRNYEYHKRYFAMLQVILDVMDEDVKKEKGITTIETLLLRLKLELGHCDMIWVDKYDSMVMTPRSISFAAMDEFEFRMFYRATLDQAIASYLPGGSDKAQSWRDMVNDAVMKLVGFF